MSPAFKLAHEEDASADASRDASADALRSKKMTMNMKNYVTETNESAGSSDGEIEAFSTSDSWDDEPSDIEKALMTAYGFEIHQFDPTMLQELVHDITIVTVKANSVLQLKGQLYTDVHIVITGGIAVIDQNSGECYTRGKILNLESLLFNQQLSAHSVSVCDTDIEIGILPCALFLKWSILKINYLKTRYTILSGLTDRTLRKFQVQHVWHDCGDALDLTGCIGLITHGVISIHDSKSLLFAGSIAGVTEIMNEMPCTATAQTFVGIAIITNQQFKKLMHQPEFQEAVNEINFQRSVLSEQLVTVTEFMGHASPKHEAHQLAKSTTTLFKSKDDKERVVLNQYTVLSKIGSGATASVFKARTQLYSDSPKELPKFLETVLKIIKRGKLESSITREINALSAMQHPNIIALQEIIDCDECPVVIIVLEFAAGGCFINCVLGHQEAKLVGLAVANALMYMHDNGFLHNDVKPANILKTNNHGIKLADFGCVSRCSDTVAPTGTPAFAAPENFDNKVTTCTDVWSLGVTLYNLIYGFVPFRSSASSTLKEAISVNELHFPPLAENNEDHVLLQELLFSVLKKNPTQRLTLIEMKAHSWLISRRKNSRKL